MKKIKLIIAFVGLFCISYIETTENKTKLSSTQQKEMNTAIRGYKDSLARIQGIVLAGKKPSSSDTKTRDAQKKIVDQYVKKHAKDPFVKEKIEDYQKFLKKLEQEKQAASPAEKVAPTIAPAKKTSPTKQKKTTSTKSEKKRSLPHLSKSRPQQNHQKKLLLQHKKKQSQ